MLFSELDIQIIDKKQTLEWLSTLNEKYWFYNEYRTCDLLSLMTETGGFNKLSSKNNSSSRDFFWTPFVPDFIKKYFEDNIFSWTKTKSRIFIIRTKAYKENPVHIDCSPQQFHTTQHKFRIVVQGKTNSLYFRTRRGDIWVSFHSKTFYNRWGLASWYDK